MSLVPNGSLRMRSDFPVVGCFSPPPTACQWPAGVAFFAHKDNPRDLHAAWFVVTPDGSSIELNHNADDAVDEARARWIAHALNTVAGLMTPNVV